ncbi:MAG: hypothetical protein ABIW76_22220 [Fibrobacteria bacterium]
MEMRSTHWKKKAALALLLIIPLQGCMTGEKENRAADSLAGRWANMESEAQVGYDKNTYFEFIFGPGNELTVTTTDYDLNPSTGRWEKDEDNSPVETVSFYHRGDVENVFVMVSPNVRPDSGVSLNQFMHWKRDGDSLFLTQAEVLNGTGPTLHGKWKSILANEGAKGRLDRDAYEFEITPGGGFVSHLSPADTIPVEIGVDTFMVKKDGNHAIYGYKLRGNTLILTLESETKHRLKRKP